MQSNWKNPTDHQGSSMIQSNPPVNKQFTIRISASRVINYFPPHIHRRCQFFNTPEESFSQTIPASAEEIAMAKSPSSITLLLEWIRSALMGLVEHQGLSASGRSKYLGPLFVKLGRIAATYVTPPFTWKHGPRARFLVG